MQIAEMMGDVRIFQAKMCTPKLHTEGFRLGLEHGYLLFNREEMGVGTIVPLDVRVNTPVVGSEDLLNDKGVSVEMPLDMGEEPGWERVGDVVGVNARGSIEVLDKDGIVGPSSHPHDTSLVNILDVASLHSESVTGEGHKT